MSMLVLEFNWKGILVYTGVVRKYIVVGPLIVVA